MTFNELPMRALLLIVGDLDVFRILIFVSRKIGLWSLKNQNFIKNYFTIKTEIPGEYTKYELCEKLHRSRGPALEYSDGTKEWCVHGERKFKRHPSIGSVYEFVYQVVTEDESRKWYFDGMLHRRDGPAVIRSDGTKMWYLNGMLHREDGPAIEHSDGSREWYFYGQLHRTNGPAIEYPGGAGQWWISGTRRLKFEEAISRFKRIPKN